MTHTPSTRTVTRDGRRSYRVTCSCGHLIVTTDSANTAEHMKTWHTTTPECAACQHRNIHGGAGCTYAGENGAVCLCDAQSVTNT